MEKDATPNGSRGELAEARTPTHGILKHKEKSNRSLVFQLGDSNVSADISPKHSDKDSVNDHHDE